ncbi:MAG: hypothetical protein HY402_06855, partial [Elusimicrobia bacterium]|nr:hypothetical protein [Elusimicrobiota bacterium]
AGLQTPRLGPLSLELALRLGYGWDDPRWKTIQERWFRELISIGPCRDREGRTTGGTCEEWRTRLLDRQTLEIGPGEKNAGFLTSAVAALRVAATPNFDLRVEFSRVFSGHPSTSANRISFGGVYTFNRSEE